MIPVIEDSLNQIIESRLKYLKDNVDIVDRIFPKTTLTMRNRLKEFISSNQIRTTKGFPRDPSQLPSYVILLGGEQEEEAALGGFMDDDDEYLETETISEVQKVMSHEGFLSVRVDKKPIHEVTSITYNGEIFYDDSFEVTDFDKGEILLYSDIEASASDEVTVEFSRKSNGTELFGTMFSSQYRVETWTTNGDLTVMMYHLLKWIFLTARDDLYDSGLVKQTLGGMDFEPSPEYFPEFVYRRAMSFSTTAEATVDKQFGYISNIVDESDFGKGE
jgi:hypothetical protein